MIEIFFELPLLLAFDTKVLSESLFVNARRTQGDPLPPTFLLVVDYLILGPIFYKPTLIIKLQLKFYETSKNYRLNFVVTLIYFKTSIESVFFSRGFLLNSKISLKS